MKRIKHILFLVLAVIYLGSIFGFISQQADDELYTHINISVDSLNGALTEREILDFLQNSSFNILGKAQGDVNLDKLENVLRDKPYIKDVNAYFTVNGMLNLDIEERIPVARIENMRGEHYFIDVEGFVIPTKFSYSPRVLVVNGYIKEPFRLRDVKNINEKRPKKLNSENRLIYDILLLSNFIHSNEFWQAQIQQIYVNDNFEIELIPRVGAHIITLGGIQNYKDKLENLRILYDQAFNNLGWNDYEFINLKYRNQIVCTKR